MKRSVTQNKHFSKNHLLNSSQLQELADMEPRTGFRRTSPTFQRSSPANRISKTPSLFHMTDKFLEEKQEMRHEKSYNILRELDMKDPLHSHKYKKLELHSKASDLQEIRGIIE